MLTPSNFSHADDFSDQLEALRQRVRLHCLRLLKNEVEAEDACQDSLTKAWEKRAGFRGDSPLDNWVMRISTNHCLSLLRKKSGAPLAWEEDKEQALPPTTDTMNASERQVWLQQVLVSLHHCMGEQNYWIWRQKADGMTEEEIVRSLPAEWRLGKHGVHSRIQRQIKDCLERERNAN